MDEPLLRLKFAALLHDPPWKPWIIAGRVKYYRECDVRGRGERHECEAERLAGELGLPWLTGVPGSAVKWADRLASSFDRAMLPREAGLMGRVVLLNIFSPDKRLEPKEPGVECIKGFIEELRGVLGRLRDRPSLAYHVFWAIYEPLWYKWCSGAAPPADTRVPTHSVFDHVYATATVSNIVDPATGKPRRGCIAVVDFAGVQRWINMSRKMRDLWASSWLASLLAWKAIEGLVEEYGPDIAVKPTLRLNWFYEAWLIGRLRGEGVHDVAERLEELFRDYSGYPGWPRHPVMPSQVTILVPCSDPGELRQRIWVSIKSAWRDIVDSVLGGVDYSRLIEVLVNSTYEKRGGALSYDEARRLLEENPPLPVRIIVARIADAYKGYVEWLRDRGAGGIRDELFYHYLLTIYVPGLEARYKNVRIDPRGIHPVWLIRSPGRRGAERTRYCSVCGRLLSVARISSAQDYEDICREATERLKNDDVSRCIPRLAGLISVGESLCPYCLVKRLVSFRYDVVMEKLMGANRERIKGSVHIPSTTLLAGEREALRLLNELEGVLDKSLCSKDHVGILRRLILSSAKGSMDRMGVSKRIADRIRGLVEKTCSGAGKGLESLLIDVIDIYMNALYGGPSTRKDVLSKLGQLLGEQGLGEYRGIVEKLKKLLSKPETAENTFILLRGDGDNMGKTLRGGIGRGMRDYVSVIASMTGAGGWAEKWVERAAEVAEIAAAEGIIVTPSYHAALSMALAASAVEDARIIEGLGGVVIYAGGDDVLAVLPPYIDGKKPAGPEAVSRLRRAYWGLLRMPHWFHVVGGGFVAALAAYGRTFSVVRAHHKYPLSTVLEKSRLAEEMAKRQITICSRGGACGGEAGKDATVYVSTQTGSEAYIPNVVSGILGEGGWDDVLAVGLLHERIGRLVEEIGAEYSVSLIYDLLGYTGRDSPISATLSSAGPSYAARMIHAVVERNKRIREAVGVMDDAVLTEYLVRTETWISDEFGQRLRRSPLIHDFVMAVKLMR